MSHEIIEKNTGLLMIFIVIAISFAGLVQIVPLFSMKTVTTPYPGVKPYSPLEVEGRDIYVREGCNTCHSQMIRPFRAETERYGPFSVAGESVYDHPFLWGSKRTGPDLARVGGRYSDAWHRNHLINPRDVVPESIMPAYPFLASNKLDGKEIANKLRALNTLYQLTCTGCETYSEETIAQAAKSVEGKTELDALVAYLQGLGLARSHENTADELNTLKAGNGQ
jgi:cytochrome c oxidase cbb3-type subunit II